MTRRNLRKMMFLTSLAKRRWLPLRFRRYLAHRASWLPTDSTPLRFWVRRNGETVAEHNGSPTWTPPDE